MNQESTPKIVIYFGKYLYLLDMQFTNGDHSETSLILFVYPV
jgi:hypothetical protein